MTHSNAKVSEHFRQAITGLRSAKHSLALGRGFLPACPRESKARQVAVALLRLEREIEALSHPEAEQTVMAGVGA